MTATSPPSVPTIETGSPTAGWPAGRVESSWARVLKGEPTTNVRASRSARKDGTGAFLHPTSYGYGRQSGIVGKGGSPRNNEYAPPRRPTHREKYVVRGPMRRAL